MFSVQQFSLICNTTKFRLKINVPSTQNCLSIHCKPQVFSPNKQFKSIMKYESVFTESMLYFISQVGWYKIQWYLLCSGVGALHPGWNTQHMVTIKLLKYASIWPFLT